VTDEYFDPSYFALLADMEDSHYWHVHRRDVVLDALRSFAPPATTGRLLEVGCGPGTVATHLNANGYVVDYADFYEEALAIARRRAVARLGEATVAARRYVRVDATRPLPVDGYAGALLLDVIEHVPDPALALAHARRVTGPRGFVVVTVPAYRFLWSPWDDVAKHKRRYTRGALVDLLERGGYEVARTTHFFGPLLLAATAVKALRLLREAVAPSPPPERWSDLVEATNGALLNRLVLGAHAPERRWLAANGGLPFGTSILAIARATS
jgi:SAM-dependent methyltransferase